MLGCVGCLYRLFQNMRLINLTFNELSDLYIYRFMVISLLKFNTDMSDFMDLCIFMDLGIQEYL